MGEPFYTTLFLDVGGVLLTNGWDHSMRALASQEFNLDLVELNKRHTLTFDTYEIGKISLDTYIERVVFYQERAFTREQFKQFMFNCSKSYPEMIELMRELKQKYRLQTIAVSNEGRELMEYRIKKFQLKSFIDSFVCSCFTGYRKPDSEVYRLALDISQASRERVIYLDDRLMLAEIGRELGIYSIQHETYEKTKEELQKLMGR